MKLILPALVLLSCQISVADAQSQALESNMLKRQAARAIRNAGYWCDQISNAYVDKVLSASGPTVVRVTCDDKTRFEQYKLTMTKDNRIAKIEVWK